jgi:hypothetical protein
VKSLIIPYLLLVTFYVPNLNSGKIDATTLSGINQSPYDGVAIKIIGACDVSVPSTFRELEETIGYLANGSRKHLWPWIFLNRILGLDLKRRDYSHLNEQSKKYFGAISGADVYNETGALNDFLEIWRYSLRLARRLGAPGIVLDPELYNDYAMNSLITFAKKLRKSPSEIVFQLRAIGASLTDIASEEYPQATIWLLFDGLETRDYGKTGYHRTPAYLILGMMDRAKEGGLPLKVVSGGEISIGYCPVSLADLQKKIKERNRMYRNHLEKYPSLLKLGGTIAPWHDSSEKKRWMTKGVCGRSSLRIMEDFQPLFKELSQAYPYVWIYAAWAAGYNPFDPKVAKRYNTVIGETFGKKGFGLSTESGDKGRN